VFDNSSDDRENTFEREMQETPIYFDELFLSKFIEEFLDDQLVDEQFVDIFNPQKQPGAENSDPESVSAQQKVFSDGLMILECDRVIFKALNAMSAKLLQEDRERVCRLLNAEMPMSPSGRQQIDIQGWYLLMFLKETLRFHLFSFLKRVQILSKIHKRLKEVHGQ
jgi:hypothetical protein